MQPAVVPLGTLQHQLPRGCAAHLCLLDLGASTWPVGLLGKPEAAMALHCQERRPERYMGCFFWKLSCGLISVCTIQWQGSDGLRLYTVPTPLARGAPAAVHRARECSLAVRGDRIFNLLPANISNQDGNFEVFKNDLDNWTSSWGCRTSL